MKIERLKYEDREYQWKLNTVEFLPNINLLVGISGAGKTQILRSINTLKRVANGGSLNGVCWDITFSNKDNIVYNWRGQFETKLSNKLIASDSEEEDEFKILYEYLDKNNQNLIERTEKEGIFFKGNKTPKLSPFKSIVELLNQEEDISPVQQAFDKIFKIENTTVFDDILRLPAQILKRYENCSLLEIKNSELPILIKLALVYRYDTQVFNKIKSVFREIFNTIEDVKIEPFNQDELPLSLADVFKEAILVKIKEKNVDTWIRQQYISLGMLKTLMYISELYLAPDDSVILIDEFENSLGINCIDSVTDLICENKHLQFIITSHHPYIINNISPEYWKIVTRKGGIVNVKTAEDFHISSSRQKAFIDLINVLEDYPEDLED
ncbi:AAA family ATPase [Crocosphaera sp. XPORK-15E]|uniref:AAA family ATPase n=1 Tax=Crocosphaera sp. XPORK-15E TaxID=3110247 RepID=UPI002B20F16F|nr:AAA family ATPase [Crocosphaera sp. XPORK-15E]MEA5532552.1 AAA family ATPase [Crocosphaera sp. XPORK-15E]